MLHKQNDLHQHDSANKIGRSSPLASLWSRNLAASIKWTIPPLPDFMNRKPQWQNTMCGKIKSRCTEYPTRSTHQSSFSWHALDFCESDVRRIWSYFKIVWIDHIHLFSWATFHLQSSEYDARLQSWLHLLRSLVSYNVKNITTLFFCICAIIIGTIKFLIYPSLSLCTRQ
jgi:hypothetical protein